MAVCAAPPPDPAPPPKSAVFFNLLVVIVLPSLSCKVTGPLSGVHACSSATFSPLGS